MAARAGHLDVCHLLLGHRGLTAKGHLEMAHLPYCLTATGLYNAYF